MLLAELQKTMSYFHDEITSLMNNDNEIKVASIGSGPGTDLVAMTEVLTLVEGPAHLRYFSIERDNDWQEQFDQVVEIYRERMENNEISLRTNINHLDVLELEEVTGAIDIFLLSYVVSEITYYGTDFHELRQMWAWMKDCIRDGGIIFFNDRNERKVREYFNEFYELVLETYPNSETYKLHFRTNGELEPYGEVHPERAWCAVFVDEDFKEQFQPKLNCKSCQLLMVIRKGG